jgi:Ca2+-binding EF-hand superfamily protein
MVNLDHSFSNLLNLTFVNQAARRRRGGESSGEENLDDVFKVFDQDGDGKISAAELGTLIRASGKNPSQKEVNEMIEEVGGQLILSIVDIFTFTYI